MHDEHQGERQEVTLTEWAARVGRSTASIRNHWRGLPGFPAPCGRRRTPGPGPGAELYELAALEAWRAEWERTRDRPAPEPYPVPGDPGAYRTLGAIARLLGVDGKTVTQYRSQLDDQAQTRPQGARTLYRVGDVVQVLNSRKGAGVAKDPGHDRRRK